MLSRKTMFVSMVSGMAFVIMITSGVRYSPIVSNFSRVEIRQARSTTQSSEYSTRLVVIESQKSDSHHTSSVGNESRTNNSLSAISEKVEANQSRTNESFSAISNGSFSAISNESSSAISNVSLSAISNESLSAISESSKYQTNKSLSSAISNVSLGAISNESLSTASSESLSTIAKVKQTQKNESLSARLAITESLTIKKNNFSLGYTANHHAVKIYDYLPDIQTSATKERRFEQIRTWLRDFPESKPEVIPKCSNVTKRILWFDIWFNGVGIRNMAKKVDFTQCCCRCEVDFFIFNDTNKLYDPISGDAVLLEIHRLLLFSHPPVKHNGQVFVGVEKEPINSTGVPLENFEYIFNWTMTFQHDSDIFYPYGRIKKRVRKPPTKNYTDIYRKKKKGIIWFVSHCITRSRREDYAKELSKYIDIDIIGKCGLDICKRYEDCTEKLEEEYFFRFNVENSYRKDYVTEKLFENFPKDMIQIVGGAADYDKLAPPKTVIDIDKFDSPKHLAAYLKKLMSSESRYTNYLKRKNKYYVEVFADQAQRAYCELCSMLHDPVRYRNLYYNIGDFFGS